jgi:hypothetical protein
MGQRPKRKAKKKPVTRKKPATGKTLARMLPTSRGKKKPKRRKPMAKDDDDKKLQHPAAAAKKHGEKQNATDPMATPPDSVSAPSQLPSETEPETKK